MKKTTCRIVELNQCECSEIKTKLAKIKKIDGTQHALKPPTQVSHLSISDSRDSFLILADSSQAKPGDGHQQRGPGLHSKHRTAVRLALIFTTFSRNRTVRE